MSKNVKINGTTYEGVPKVTIPNSTGDGTSDFYDTTPATAAGGDILSGKTAFIGAGEVTGSMPNNGAVSPTLSTKDGKYTIPAGYHNGSGTVSISTTEQGKIISGNIKSGVTILGVAGSSSVVDTKDATAAAGPIVSGKTAYINGAKVTGNLTLIAVTQDANTKALTIS